MKPKIDIEGLKNTLLNFVVPIVAVSVCGLLGFFVIYPAIRDTPGIKQEIEQNNTTTNQLTDKLTRLKRFADFKTILEENQTIVSQAMPSEADIPKFLDQLFQISNGVGFRLERLTHSGSQSAMTAEEAAGSGAKYVTASLGVKGDYEQAVIFLKNLESASRLLLLKDFRFADTTTGNDLPQIDFSIDSPYLMVSSVASTDAPIDLDLSSVKYLDLIGKIKGLTQYEFTNAQIPQPVVQPESEEATASPSTETP